MFFRGSGGHSLFGVLHRPAQVDDRKAAFVFCHPLAEEKLWAHRVFVAFARLLAASGHPVLLLGLRGICNCGGRFSDLSLQIACDDIRVAMHEVRRLTGATSTSLLGLRLGATFASLVAEETPDVRHLVLWSPILDGDRYLQELLRINVMTQMATYKVVRLRGRWPEERRWESGRRRVHH